MLNENVLIRPLENGLVSISWTSATKNTWSWIFVNGKLACGPYMAETKNRSISFPIPQDATFIVEVHDFEDETIPTAISETPLVKPQIAWNAVESAAAYRVYHTIYEARDLRLEAGSDDNNVSISSLLTEIPARYAPHPSSLESQASRLTIDCPVKLEGRNGRWHSFRVESVDQFGNESENESVAHFAADLPPVPNLEISRDTEIGLLSFRIRFEV